MAIAAFRAGEAISPGDAVYVSAGSLLFKGAGFTEAEASVVGIAIDGGAVGQLIRVNTDSIYPGLSGLTPGESLYLSFTTPGAVVDYATWAADLTTVSLNPYLTRVGRAIASSAVEVEISRPIGFVNPTQVLLLESSTGIALDAVLQEDGSFIDLEAA
jgi:hypothetical protein